MRRRHWEDLPAQVRSAVEDRIGVVLAAESPSAGRNSDLSATLTTGDRRIFCKGIVADSPKAQMHRHEAAINRWLPRGSTPRLLWQVETDGWLVLGFEHITGQHADLSPGSPDLPLIAETVSTLAATLTPCPPATVRNVADQWRRLAAWRRIARDMPGTLDGWAAHNLTHLIEWESLAIELVNGDSLQHTDLHPLNILVNDTARVIDWAWSRRGAAWFDTAFLVIRLIDAGHTPESAEKWADSIPAWRQASDTARTAFAVAVLGIWEHLARTDPRPIWPHLTAAAQQWAQHRMTTTPRP